MFNIGPRLCDFTQLGVGSGPWGSAFPAIRVRKLHIFNQFKLWHLGCIPGSLTCN